MIYMYKIFNYNKNQNKNVNYKLYKFLLIMLYISFLFILVYMCFNSKIGIILFVLWIILFIILNLVVYFLLKKYFNCNAYILNEDNQEFYKIGVFPNVIRFTPTDEEFISDNYFANYVFSNIGKAFKLHISKQLNYSLNEYVKDNVKLKFSESNQLLYLNILIKLNNPTYILNQLNNNKFSGKAFKITNIYSYDLNQADNYYIVCDVIENNKKTEYKNIKLTINKLFDKDSNIKNYIINNCEDNFNSSINEEVNQ